MKRTVRKLLFIFVLPSLMFFGACGKSEQFIPREKGASEAASNRLSVARISPLKEEEMNTEQHAILDPIYKDGRFIGVQGTFARHWPAFKALMGWGYHVMGPTSTLPPRDRELALLRIGWLCQSEYEWSQHAAIGESTGITGEEVERIKEGPSAHGWSQFDSALLRATDELFYSSMISDDTWNTLSTKYSEAQLMDFVFAVGTYNMYSWAFNTFGVQLGEGSKGF